MRSLDLDGLIAIGGEDTLGAAAKLHAEHDLPVIGVPKTIDNDLGGTDMTFGFDTAVQVATEAIDRLHTTAESHNRVMVVEVMGRHAGWIALHSGIAGGADVILIPERPFDIDEVCRLISSRHSRGRFFSIVVVAEGAVPLEGTMEVMSAGEDEFGHARLGGIGQRLEAEIESRTGYETRATVLGHVQRGGTPTAFDRVLATRLGVTAIDGADERRWGTMAALRGTNVELIPLTEAVAELRTVPPHEYDVAAASSASRSRLERARSERRGRLSRTCRAASTWSMYGFTIRAVAATTTMIAVSRNASKALMPKAQAVIHQTRPTTSVTYTDMSGSLYAASW